MLTKILSLQYSAGETETSPKTIGEEKIPPGRKKAETELSPRKGTMGETSHLTRTAEAKSSLIRNMSITNDYPSNHMQRSAHSNGTKISFYLRKRPTNSLLVFIHRVAYASINYVVYTKTEYRPVKENIVELA